MPSEITPTAIPLPSQPAHEARAAGALAAASPCVSTDPARRKTPEVLRAQPAAHEAVPGVDVVDAQARPSEAGEALRVGGIDAHVDVRLRPARARGRYGHELRGTRGRRGEQGAQARVELLL